MRLFCRVDCNSITGFGHLSRVLNLVRNWEKCFHCSEYLFVGNINSFGRELLESENITVLEIKDEKYSDLMLSYADKADFAIFDSYNLTQSSINNIKILNSKTILFQDECSFDYLNINYVVNFRFNAERMYKYNSLKELLGVNYFIVHPHLVELRAKNRFKSNDSINNILLFFGGGFQNEAFIEKVINIINRVLPTTKVFLLGSSDFKIKGNFEYVASKPDISEILEKTDMVINGGGLIKYEASFCLIPTASFSTSELQHEDSEILESYGVHINLGKVQEVSFKDKLIDFLQNNTLRDNMIEASTKIYPDNPTKNLINSLL